MNKSKNLSIYIFLLMACLCFGFNIGQYINAITIIKDLNIPNTIFNFIIAISLGIIAQIISTKNAKKN